MVRRRTAKYVYTNKPCSRGHIGPRYKNGNCVECLLLREKEKAQSQEFVEAKRNRERNRYKRQSTKESRQTKYKRFHTCNPEWRKQNYINNKNKRLSQVAEYRSKYPDRVRQFNKSYRNKNKAKVRNNMKRWRINNPEKTHNYYRNHYLANTQYYLHKRKLRELSLHIPMWANVDKIRDIYKTSKELSKSLGIKMSVDHIIPLHGINSGGEHVVCGLHWEGNLQIIPHTQNLQKWAKFNATVTSFR